jgi:hypothetical protein
MASLPRMLHPAIVNERISRLRVINKTLQSAFGMTAGGGNVRQIPSRRGSYDVFDDTRNVANASLPGTTSNTIARNPVGNVPFTIPRAAEKLPLLMEEINQLRSLGGPTGEVDQLGETYIMDQERVFKQRYTNLREFQLSALLRGSYTYTQSGNELVHTYTGGSITVNYQIPTGNLSQLNMTTTGGNILGVAWDDPAAPIVRDLLAINSAFNQIVGLGLTDVWCTSVVWGMVITNTEVQNLAGAVNDPVMEMSRDMEKQTFTARLKSAPWVTWHIIDNGLNVNGTFGKLIPDTHAVFHVPIDSSIAQYYECPEPVVDPVTNQQKNVWGEYYYHKLQDDPVSYEFHGRFNGLPILKVPAAIAYGEVDF